MEVITYSLPDLELKDIFTSKKIQYPYHCSDRYSSTKQMWFTVAEQTTSVFYRR